MKKKKIMIVDDDVVFLDEIKEILEEKGYKVLDISDSERVVSEAEKARPDLILMDLRMTPKSGFQLSDELRSNQGTSDLPVVSMSAYFTRKEDRLLRTVCGITHHINKPVKPGDLFPLIEKVTQERESKT